MFRHRMGLAVALAAAALSLGACKASPTVATSPTGSAPPGAAVTPSAVLLTGDKALYAAEAAYVGGLQLVNAGLDAKLIHGSTAVAVKTYVQQANSALQSAKAARTLGDTAVETSQALAALGLIGQATAILPAATPGKS